MGMGADGNKSNKIMFIIDGNSLINREYYGMPPLTTRDGLYTNAILGFINKLIKYIDQLSPDYAAVAFDLPAPTFRHIEYSGYKAGRKGMPEELAMQLPYVKEACDIFGFSVLTQEGFEADDILGTIAKKCVGTPYMASDGTNDNSGGRIHTYILTGDRDSFQLVSDHVTVLYSSNNSVAEFTPQKIAEDYGIEPKQLIEVKALMGDSSDEIPGVKGIGEKTALKLIQENGDLNHVYKNLENGTLNMTPSNKQKLTDGKESAYMSRKLAEIFCDVPLNNPVPARRAVDKIKLYDFCKKLELNSIIKKLNLTAVINEQIQLDLFASDDMNDPENPAIDFKEEPKNKKEYIKFDNPANMILNFNDGELLFVIIDFDLKIMFADNNSLFYAVEFNNISDLSPFFSGKFKICSNNIKNIYLEFKKAEIKIDRNIFIFDFELAGYVLNPSDTKYDLTALSYKYLHTDLTEDPRNINCCSLYRAMSKKIKDLDSENLYYGVEIPLAFVLGDMEYEGFLIDRDNLSKFGDELNRKASEIQHEIYFLSGIEFNINSPKQLGEVLFEQLKLPYGKKNKTGYSTDIDVMNKLRPLHPAIALILEYRAVTKLKSTYCDGLVKLSDSNGRLHTSFNQTITATGRLSSTEPNLQNIPVRTNLGREIRKFFIAGDGFVLVDADYSQIELRVLAHISGDETLINAFKNNSDIHRLTASQVFGIPENEVTSEMRSKAKAVNFGIVYGISDFSLSEDIGVSVKEAREYIESYFLKYPKVKQFIDDIILSAKKSGYVKTILNRIRYIKDINMPNRNIAAFGERVARNTPIQGSAADIIKLAMLACHERFEKEKLKSRLILQVHDELLFETDKNEIDIVSKIVKYEMENVYKMDVPLVVDISVGNSWYEAKE